MATIWLQCGLLVSVCAQDCPEPFLGSKTLYTSSSSATKTTANNYLPVFINHVGRHGARHLTSDVMGSAIAKLLLRADSAGALTPTGKALLEKITKLAKVEKPHIKSISQQGIMEQQGIANRMFQQYAAVFNQPKPVIHIDYTKEVRTLQTSNAFMETLAKNINSPAITRQINDTTLRFYDLSPAYLRYEEKGNWIPLLEKVKTSLHEKELANSTAKKFFIQTWLDHMTDEDKATCPTGLYSLISISYSIQKEISDAGYTPAELDMQSYLDCKELAILSEIDNAEDFLMKGPAANASIQVTIAAPLLADFIASTDAYIKDKSTQANLRFSHAETIAPFAALLSLETASTPAGDPSSIKKVWHASQVIPLSANIQWILYQQKGSGKYFIRFLLNEKETAVRGLRSKAFPYYEWTTVRQFYLQRLQTLGLQPTGNYYQYLLQLK